MYETFFRFQRRPFASVPVVDQYFPAAAIEQARQSLSRCIERAAGPGVLIGASGSGKTLLLGKLAAEFADRFQTAHCGAAQLGNRRDLLRTVLYELGLPYRDMEEGELRLSLIDHLTGGKFCRAGLVLLIDEAHALSSKLLEEVRLLTNLVQNGQPRVRLVMAGSPSLEERLSEPALESFNQRIAARCYLDAFSTDETAGYVRAQMDLAGALEQVFADDALTTIHSATDGIPRLINQLCDHALMLASLGGRRRISAEGVEEAWSDLQQLPAPWQPWDAEPSPKEADTVVEFGVLEDEDEPSDPPSMRSDDAYKLAPLDARHEAEETPSSNAASETHPEGDEEEHAAPDEHEIDPLEDSISAEEEEESRFEAATRVIFSGPAEHGHDSLDPCGKLNQIERAVASIDQPAAERADTSFHEDESYESDSVEEFRSAGVVGPEVGLSAVAANDPFSEEFLEEEVVIDRYATLDMTVCRRRLQVSTEEGKQLEAAITHAIDAVADAKRNDLDDEVNTEAGSQSSMAPHEPDSDLPVFPTASVQSQWSADEMASIDVVHPPEEDLEAVAAMYDRQLENAATDSPAEQAGEADEPQDCHDWEATCVDDAQAIKEFGGEDHPDDNPAPGAVEEADPGAVEEPHAAGEAAPHEESEPISLKLPTSEDSDVDAEPSASSLPDAARDDRDLIVVEDAPMEHVTGSRFQAKRQEYRQLFARLRRR